MPGARDHSRTDRPYRLLIAMAVLGGIALGVGPALASGQTATGGDAQVDDRLTECTTITESGTYVVDAPIEADGRAPCIRVIGTDSVVIEGNGYTMRGGRIGLDIRDSREVSVRNLSVAEVALFGIGVWNSDSVELRGNAVSRTGTEQRWNNNSIHVWESTDVEIRGNTVVDSLGHSDGLYVGRSSDVTVTGNEVTDATMRSVGVLQSEHVRIEGNAMANPGTVGRAVGVHDVVDVTVTGNSIEDARYGVEAKRNSTGVVIRDNDIANTTLCAIEAEGSREGRVTDVLIEDNRMDRTGPMGVWVNTTNIVVRNNTVTNAPGLGMYIRGVDDDVEVYRNTFVSSGLAAIHVNETRGGLHIYENEFRELHTGIRIINSADIAIEGNRFVGVDRETEVRDGTGVGEDQDAQTVGPGQRGLGIGVALIAVLVLVSVRRRLAR